MQMNIFHQLQGKSQADKVLWHLEQYGRITNMQCHELYGIRHCPSVIRDIRKRLSITNKYEIINETKKGCNRFGEKVRWDEYVLKEKQEQTA